MNVSHFEARRFWVESESKDTRPSSSEFSCRNHLVDLDENGGLGECSCEQHIYRRQPELDRGRLFPECKHVSAARRFERAETELHTTDFHRWEELTAR